MGNRTHVIFTDGQEFSPAVYLHWNGSAESVYPFLDELRSRMGGRIGDVSYSAARFVALVADFFGLEDGLSLGIVNGPESDAVDDLEPFDHGDNGIFLVNVRTDLVRRFTSRRGPHGDQLNEWARPAVDNERKYAWTHAYREGLGEFFDDFRTMRNDMEREKV